MEESDQTTLQNVPGIFVIGSSNVGKRTLLSRLLSREFEDASDLSEIQQHGWTIDTKYYTADVSVWMSNLHDAFSLATLPFYNRITALVMVFDLNDISSFVAVQEWASRIDIHKFEILLCIGNKVDLIPGHPVHTEYRRRLQKIGESSDDPHPEFDDFGISETEGTSLLVERDEEPSWDIRRSSLEWCTEHGIEYVEACASNADFDKCLSVDGDSQGIERLYGALSAHMWSGMVLKSGNQMAGPMFPAKEEMSEEESDYEFEYEVLSAGSAEPYDDTFGGWISVNSSHAASSMGDHKEKGDKEVSQPSTSNNELQDGKGESTKTVPDVEESDKNMQPDVEECDKNTITDEVEPFDFEDLEQLMSEIGNVRDSLRFMPDFQRREMAANLALKMAAMFGGGSDDEEEVD